MAFANSFVDILDSGSLVGSREGTSPNYKLHPLREDWSARGPQLPEKQAEIRREIGVQAWGYMVLLLCQAPPNSQVLGDTYLLPYYDHHKLVCREGPSAVPQPHQP